MSGDISALTEYLAHLRDFSFAGHEADNVDATVQNRHSGHQALNAETCAVDIENRDYDRVLVGGAFYQLRYRIYGIAFDAYKDDVGFACIFFGGIGFDG